MPHSTTSLKTVRDIMTKEPVCVEPAMGIRQLARVLEENEISGAPVIGANGKLIGVVSKTDLVRRWLEGSEEHDELAGLLASEEDDEERDEFDEDDDEPVRTADIAVEDFMSDDPITATPEETVGVVAKRMAESRVHRVIVVDGEFCPIGIVTSLDVLKAFPR
ncbi:MAG: CBS domain-containing protein [Phycisphaerae bacterium]|nr:CBS domain-containing protein [Phycisphaerae bacterium]